ncbi:MAG: hypothetical protein ACLUD2_07720 [Clostridium sp.]
MARWITDGGTTCQAFPDAFETMYLEHGAKPVSSVMWDAGDVLYRAEFMAEYQKEQIHPADPKQTVLVYRMETGAVIRIGVTKETDLQADHPYRFEYQFNWQELSNVSAVCLQLSVSGKQAEAGLSARRQQLCARGNRGTGRFCAGTGYADHSNGYGRNSVVPGGK